MPSQQSMLNIAAYAALSLAGVGSCMLPDELPGTALVDSEYVEVPMIERDQAAPIEDAEAMGVMAWSDSDSSPLDDPAKAVTRRGMMDRAGRDRNELTSTPAVGQ